MELKVLVGCLAARKESWDLLQALYLYALWDKMQSTTSGIPIDAAADIVHMLEICGRLKKWTRQPMSSPLISLVQQHVEKLAIQAQYLGKRFTDPTSLSDADKLDEVAELVQSVKELLFPTLALLDFCSTMEKEGDEGALNALFSSLLVMNDTNVDLGGVRYITDRMHQSRQECYQILSRRFGPEASSRNWWWGTGPKPSTDVFQELV